MIDNVVRFPNDIVMVFDENGRQMPAYEGRYEEVRDKVLADAPQSAKFFHGTGYLSGSPIPRKDW